MDEQYTLIAALESSLNQPVSNPQKGLEVFLDKKPGVPQKCSTKLFNILEKITVQILDKSCLGQQDIYQIRLVLLTLQQLSSYSPTKDGLEVLINIGLERMISGIMVTALHCVRDRKSDDADQMYETLLETIVAVAEYSREAQIKVVQWYCDRLLQVSASNSFRFITRFETIKSINLLLDQCPIELRNAMATLGHHCEMMHRIAVLIPHAGDYEHQVSLIETLFRLTHKANRRVYAKGWFEKEEFLMAFLCVRDSEFEMDCRSFLNIVNDPQYGYNSVMSYPCQKIFIGKYELFKPEDENLDFWVDFNTASRRLSFFCYRDFKDKNSQIEEDNLWETVSVWENNLIGYEIQEKENINVLWIQTLSNAKDLIGFGPYFTDRNVFIEFEKQYLLQEAMSSTFSGKNHIINQPKVKASEPIIKKLVKSCASSSSSSSDINSSTVIVPSLDKNTLLSQTKRKVSVSMTTVATNGSTSSRKCENGVSVSGDKKRKLSNTNEETVGKNGSPSGVSQAITKAKRVKTPLKIISNCLKDKFGQTSSEKTSQSKSSKSREAPKEKTSQQKTKKKKVPTATLR